MVGQKVLNKLNSNLNKIIVGKEVLNKKKYWDNIVKNNPDVPKPKDGRSFLTDAKFCNLSMYRVRVLACGLNDYMYPSD